MNTCQEALLPDVDCPSDSVCVPAYSTTLESNIENCAIACSEPNGGKGYQTEEQEHSCQSDPTCSTAIPTDTTNADSLSMATNPSIDFMNANVLDMESMPSVMNAEQQPLFFHRMSSTPLLMNARSASMQHIVGSSGSCVPLLMGGGIHTSLNGIHTSLTGINTGKITPANTLSSLQLEKLHRSVLALDSRSDTNSAMLPFCRICHQIGDSEDEILISPCRCMGTLQYIHTTCLMRWLEIMSKRSRKPPKCELCHYQYHRHKKFNFHQWRWPRVSRGDKVLHIIFLVMLVIMVVCAVATVMCFLSDKGQISKFPRNKVDLTTEEIVTLSCGVLFFVTFFIAMSVQIKAKHTIYQLFVKFIMHNMIWEIDEYDKSKDTLFSSKIKKKNFV